MKKILVSLSLFSSFSLFSQATCCKKVSAGEDFAMLGSDKAFAAAHLEPEAFTLIDPKGKDITFPCADGKKGHAYELKSGSPSNQFLFVIHEWWGLNDHIRQEAEKFQSALGNVNVIAIDLYDYQIASSRDSAAKYMQSVKTERAQAILKGVLDYVGPEAQISSVGWCFGGGWSSQSALISGKQTRSCVMYYGAPEENIEKLKGLNGPVLFVWPEQDQWINKAMVDKFSTKMKACNKKLEVISYNADHAFANPSNPKYSKTFAEDAFGKAIKFINMSW